jgi:hypothetical protein
MRENISLTQDYTICYASLVQKMIFTNPDAKPLPILGPIKPAVGYVVDT